MRDTTSKARKVRTTVAKRHQPAGTIGWLTFTGKSGISRIEVPMGPEADPFSLPTMALYLADNEWEAAE